MLNTTADQHNYVDDFTVNEEYINNICFRYICTIMKQIAAIISFGST